MFCFEIVQKMIQVTKNTFGRKRKSMSSVSEYFLKMLLSSVMINVRTCTGYVFMKNYLLITAYIRLKIGLPRK